VSLYSRRERKKMPHIIVEYSKNLGDAIEVPNLISNLHDTLSEQGIDKSRIKSRAIAYNDVVVGDKGASGYMMHITLLILKGRDTDTKKLYGDTLHQVMKDAVKGMDVECSTTLEIREMNKETYYM